MGVMFQSWHVNTELRLVKITLENPLNGLQNTCFWMFTL